MTGETPDVELSPVQRVAAATTAEERPMLESFLDFYRDALVRKVDGLSEEQVRRQLVGSRTTLAGLVKHLRAVEMGWFQRTLAQVPEGELPVATTGEEPDLSFAVDDTDTLAELIAAYRQQCALSREFAGRYPLSTSFSHRELGEVSLRWIYVHMIEETARHLGHADVLREQIDGATGYF